MGVGTWTVGSTQEHACEAQNGTDKPTWGSQGSMCHMFNQHTYNPK